MHTMLLRRNEILAVMAVLLIGLCACTSQKPVDSGKITDYASLTSALQAQHLNVQSEDRIEDICLPDVLHILTVNGEQLLVMESSDATATASNARYISSDGSRIGQCNKDYVATSHYFMAGNLIVIYIGDSQEILGVLKSILGAQFAGRAVNDQRQNH